MESTRYRDAGQIAEYHARLLLAADPAFIGLPEQPSAAHAATGVGVEFPMPPKGPKTRADAVLLWIIALVPCSLFGFAVWLAVLSL